jgi:hypothetical protein
MVKRLFQAAVIFFLVACGDDASSSASAEGESSAIVAGESSSSSVTSSENASSSSVAKESSSETESSSSENISSSSLVFSSSVDSSKYLIPDDSLYFSTTVVEDTFEIFAFGSVNLNIAADSFLTKFDYGDFVTVMIDGYDTLDVPVVASYSDVFPGEIFLYVSEGLNYIKLEARYGQMAEVVGFGRDITFPIEVTIRIQKKGGYIDHLQNLRSLSISYYQEAYPDLSVEDFANFRMVKTTGMGEGTLYRSSNPVDPSIGRNKYADSLSQVAGVKTFVNLADGKENAELYNGYADSYYASQNVVYLDVQPTFANTQFKEGLVTGLRYMIEHEGPYLVHCTYGMDRTGYTIAVLEALMGATAEEIKTDYVKTHQNFFNVKGGKQVALTSKQVGLIQAIIVRLMRTAYKVEGVDISDFENTDLAAATEKYLLSLGMEKSEIEALKNRLR